MLGTMWPHRLPDHAFAWSRAGLLHFWAHRGFTLERRFSPQKHVSTAMLVAHLLHKVGLSRHQIPRVLDVPLRFNVGEMGVLLRRA
jgi:hypothetical protein